EQNRTGAARLLDAREDIRAGAGPERTHPGNELGLRGTGTECGACRAQVGGQTLNRDDDPVAGGALARAFERLVHQRAGGKAPGHGAVHQQANARRYGGIEAAVERNIGRRLRASPRGAESQHQRQRQDPAGDRHVRPVTVTTELAGPKSLLPARGALGSAIHRTPSTTNAYSWRPASSGIVTLQTPSRSVAASGVAPRFQELKSPTSDTLDAPGAATTKRTALPSDMAVAGRAAPAPAGRPAPPPPPA